MPRVIIAPRDPMLRLTPEQMGAIRDAYAAAPPGTPLVLSHAVDITIVPDDAAADVRPAASLRTKDADRD